MAHPKRAGWVPQLADAIAADVQVVWDRHNDRWDTGRRSLLAYNKDATHHLVVQDDALVCEDLTKAVTGLVDHTGDHPVSLYMGRLKKPHTKMAVAYHRSVQKQWSFVAAAGPFWGVAILLPVAHIERVVAHGDGLNIPNYDLRIADWYRRQKLLCWYTVPSLVQHRNGTSNPSLIPNRTGKNRYAHHYIGGGNSALSVDWSATPR